MWWTNSLDAEAAMSTIVVESESRAGQEGKAQARLMGASERLEPKIGGER